MWWRRGYFDKAPEETSVFKRLMVLAFQDSGHPRNSIAYESYTTENLAYVSMAIEDTTVPQEEEQHRSNNESDFFTKVARTGFPLPSKAAQGWRELPGFQQHEGKILTLDSSSVTHVTRKAYTNGIGGTYVKLSEWTQPRLFLAVA